MAEGFAVDAQQIRAHAMKIDEVRQRFSAIEGASTAITQDHAAAAVVKWAGRIMTYMSAPVTSFRNLTRLMEG